MMKAINKEVLKIAANKLMFEMSEIQYDTLLKEFDVFARQIELIDNIPNVNDAKPMTFPFDNFATYMREDIATEPLKKEDVLKNSSDVFEGQIRLPKVVK